MNYRLVLLIAALFCAGMLVAIDLRWLTPEHPHPVAWLGFSLFFYMLRDIER